ncbi:MAG TPA: sodium:proton antiporter [Steroidobacteraceae bacterium]|nr:sodium:proton antiporter [Steroidobacteraceae bacterium]
MGIFELVIALLLIGAVLALWSDKVGVPYPAALALAGAGLALLPGTPVVMLDPQLALALFVAPVLLDAAYDASPRDLRDNLVPLVSLALVVVFLTIFAVAFVAHRIIPDLSWPAAVTLGAIVAPPDASAATAVLRRLRPPHRLLVILEGESLFNDASALLVYRLAAAAAISGAPSHWNIVPTLLLTCGGGVLVGWLLARSYMWLTTWVDDIPISIILQFVGTFAVWLIADRLGLSAIITVISYAMTLARRVPGRIDARHRIASYAVWEVAVFVLNVLAFVLIGLQLRPIVARMAGSDWHTYVQCAAAVCVTVIVVRIVWVMLYGSAMRWKLKHFGAGKSRPPRAPTFGAGIVVSWSGMRGLVTLAAALALPDGSAALAFPYRDLIVLCAFCVVLCTLVVQGLTLRPLMSALGLKDDGSVEREVRLARVETARAALRELAQEGDHPAVDILRAEYEARIRSGERIRSAEQTLRADTRLTQIQRRVVMAQRRTLMDLRARSVVGDYAFHAAEEEIDLLELTADERIKPGPDGPGTEDAPR